MMEIKLDLALFKELHYGIGNITKFEIEELNSSEKILKLEIVNLEDKEVRFNFGLDLECNSNSYIRPKF